MQVLSTPKAPENASPSAGILRRDVMVGVLAATAAAMAAPALAAGSANMQISGDRVSDQLAMDLDAWKDIRAEKDAALDVTDALLDLLNADRNSTAARAAYDESDKKLDALYNVMWGIEERIIKFPCRTAADAAAKARFIQVVTEGDDICAYGWMMSEILQSMLGLAPEQMHSA
ncbi:hypothetical protein M2360_000732 [Rhizobium sp. SG_E_25_P2]|uniref:hypothetical protein n=1 Tax=Rhizobium sp. SG_E_25_P2 TaxID=2879942 RepID=UPI0024765930|nr:hypothetical protein [Rhizobium sp. SG_E_25_P2]MDH6265351.1 hypothetical protein [Rhizobium sp. SG_E_25_P2]